MFFGQQCCYYYLPSATERLTWAKSKQSTEASDATTGWTTGHGQYLRVSHPTSHTFFFASMSRENENKKKRKKGYFFSYCLNEGKINRKNNISKIENISVPNNNL